MGEKGVKDGRNQFGRAHTKIYDGVGELSPTRLLPGYRAAHASQGCVPCETVATTAENSDVGSLPRSLRV